MIKMEVPPARRNTILWQAGMTIEKLNLNI